jgi:hypothetical protein
LAFPSGDKYPHGSGDAEPFACIRAGTDRLPPPAVLQIPFDSFLKSRLEAFTGAPTEISFDLRRIYGVASIVPRAVRYEAYQTATAAAVKRYSRV